MKKFKAETLFNRVEPSGVKRVTAQEPAQAHPPAAERAVALDRLQSIFRTGRDETAGRRQQRRDARLVETQKGYED